MALKFNPPVPEDRFGISYGSQFRTYSSLGTAKNAYHHIYRGEAETIFILEKVEGSWFILYEVKAGTPYAELPWTRKVRSYGWYGGTPYTRHQAVPMSAQEYAEWRLKVEYERLSQMQIDEVLQTINNVSV